MVITNGISKVTRTHLVYEALLLVRGGNNFNHASRTKLLKKGRFVMSLTRTKVILTRITMSYY